MIPQFVTNPQPDIFIRGSPLFLDFETTTLHKGSPHNPQNRIVLACWYFRGEWKYCFGSEYEQKELLEDLKACDFLVAQNAKFELGWLKRCGVELRDVLVYDTMLAEWVIAGNRSWDLDLGSMAERYGVEGKVDAIKNLIELGVCPSSMPPGLLRDYCFQDVRAMMDVYFAQLPYLTANHMLGIVYQRGLVCACLADIEFEGLYLDKQAVLEEYTKTRDELIETQEELRKFCGEVKLSSKPKMAAFVYDTLGFEELKKKGQPIRTPKGGRKVDQDTLVQLKATTKEQRRFVTLYQRYSELSTLLSKNLNFFQAVCDHKDGRFFGELLHCRTVTHRLASAGRPITIDGKVYKVQLQNLPKQYKKLFTAPEGHSVGEADGAQLEFRMAAIMSHDPVACPEIAARFDVHRQTSDFLTERKQETSRDDAKGITFTPLFYGMGKTKPEREYAEFFKNKYKGIWQMEYSWMLEVARTGKLVTPYGLIAYWKGTTFDSRGYCNHGSQISNLPIQGLSTGEAFPCGVVWFWHRTRGLDIRLALTVHDSVIAYIKQGLEKEFTEIAVQSLTRDVYFYLERLYGIREFPAPLGVGVKIGTHWGKGEETKVDVPYTKEIQNG